MKKKNYRLIVFILGLIAFQSILYFLVKLTPFPRTILYSTFDNKLPFIKEFVYFYFMWYIMLLIIPYIIYKQNKDCFYDYVSSNLICILIANVTFLILPTIIDRGAIIVNDLSSWLVNFIYTTDTPNLNCLPSMHCVMCFLFIYYILKCKKMKWYEQTGIIIVSLLVVTSTIFIKQHVIWDVIAALIVTVISIIATKLWPISKKICKICQKLSL